MGMTGNFMQISPDELESLQQQPDSVESYLLPDDGGFPSCCDVDKAWQGIHFLLAGDPWGGEDAAAKAVLGGTEIGGDLGYGPARYLTATEVKEVADAISRIDRDELKRRFDAQAMADADIYAFHHQSLFNVVRFVHGDDGCSSRWTISMKPLWEDKALTIEHLSSSTPAGTADSIGIHFTCTCRARLDIPHDGPFDYSPGTMMHVTGGLIVECPHCGTRFSWNCNAPEKLYEISETPES